MTNEWLKHLARLYLPIYLCESNTVKIGVLYYFSLLEVQKMGCRFLDMGGTRPFLTDGLTKYKINLGGQFETDLSPMKDYLWLGANEHSIFAKEFLQKNPVMYLSKDFKLVKYGT